jgi:hypothetical protein
VRERVVDTIAATGDFVVHELVNAPSAPIATSKRRRRIGPEAGRGLEILGHAIEYLADEYIHSSRTFSAYDPEVQAIQLLMDCNRQIYFECPVVPTWAERLRSFFNRGAK